MAAPFMPDAFRRIAPEVANKVQDNVARMGMSPRQLELNRRWSYYCCAQYDARVTDWDGTPRVDPVEREAIASAAFLPPGFYDAGGQLNDMPLQFRRPTAPYNLGRVIVDRFTGLLFSERRHPKLAAIGDPDTEDYVNALAEECRLWMTMVIARGYGGATGTAVVGFMFLDGKPTLEIHDPRWTLPRWKDRDRLVIAAIEKRYQFPKEVKNVETGEWETVWFWYRRIIDDTLDIVYEPVEVGDGEEPEWKRQTLVEHNLGFCPVVWIQNLPVLDDIDGEPDILGIYDNIETIDKLLAQAVRGTIANCDPTPVMEGIENTEVPSQIRKGSGNLIKLPKGTFRYAEITGEGPKAALELADKQRAFALEVAQCVLDHPDMAGRRTATEIERIYSSMLSKADILREQYGQRGVLALVRMMVAAIRQREGRATRDGDQIVREAIFLPPRVDDDGKLKPRKLGKSGAQLTLAWPGYFEPSVEDAQQATQAANTAKIGQLIDEDHASKFVATYFNVEDVPAMLAKMKQAKLAEQQGMTNQIMSGLPGAAPQPGGVAPRINPVTGKMQVPFGARAGAAGKPQEPQEYTQYELDSGLVTRGQWAESKGLPPPKDPDLTVPEFKAKYAKEFLAAVGTEDQDLGAQVLEDEYGIKPPPQPGGPPGGGGPPPKGVRSGHTQGNSPPHGGQPGGNAQGGPQGGNGSRTGPPPKPGGGVRPPRPPRQ